MKFTPKFFIEFYTALKTAFRKEWPNGLKPTSDYNLWRLTEEMVSGHITTSDVYIVKIRLEVNEKYYYEQRRRAHNGELVIIQDAKVICAFNYLGCYGENTENLLDAFIQLHKVSPDISEPQKKLNENDVKLITATSPTKSSMKQEITLRGIGQKCRRFLPGTKWWYYIYGYEPVNDYDYQNREWLLLRLLLSFNDEGNSNLEVTLENIKDNDDYVSYSYKGSTDYLNSSEIVLSIRLYSEPGAARSLVININIGKGSGSFFMGQYLNYDETGYITSGAVALEKIDKEKNSEPEPKEFFISRSASAPSDYPSEVSHIAYLFQDRRLNFRRTPTLVYSLNDLERWQEKRKRERL